MIYYILYGIFMIWYQKLSLVVNGISLAKILEEELMLAAKQYTIREDYIVFKCSYTQSINSFNMISIIYVHSMTI